MEKTKAIEHFGNAIKMANVLGITSGSVSQWGDIIPEKQALKLDKITKGKLKYNPDLYIKAA